MGVSKGKSDQNQWSWSPRNYRGIKLVVLPEAAGGLTFSRVVKIQRVAHMPHCSKISKNVSKKSEFTLRKLEKIVKIEQVLHKRHLTIFSFINDYRWNDRFYGHLVHCEKLIACFFYCFVQPKTIIWNRFWPRWHFMQIWLHHFRCHQKLSLVIFGQTFRLYFPSNYLHDWLCIEACDDDIKKWLQNHRSTKKKEVFHLKEKVGFSQLEGLFLTVFEVLLAFCTSYTLWQNPIFCPKI